MNGLVSVSESLYAELQVADGLLGLCQNQRGEQTS